MENVFRINHILCKIFHDIICRFGGSMEVYVLLWEERDASWLCGIFNSVEDARKHLLGELEPLAQKRRDSIAMWLREAEKATGNDKKHALYLAQLDQNELDLGVIENTKEIKGTSFPDNTLSIICYCEETFTI